MKHLKKFENFYLNDETGVDADEQEYLDQVKKLKQVNPGDEDDLEDFDDEDEDDDCETCDHAPIRKKVWGDEVVEGKKSKVKKEKKTEEEKPKKGLSAKQKKLPPALQAAILKRMKK